MITHTVKVYPSKIKLDKKNQLAWKLAEISSDNVKLNKKNGGILNIHFFFLLELISIIKKIKNEQ